MASWTSGNPVSIGNPTKKSDADVFFDNGQFEKDSSTGAILTTLQSLFAAGTTGAPTIAATGDTNTGVWFPGADIVALSTGGTERIRFDASGNIGITMAGGTIDAPIHWVNSLPRFKFEGTGASSNSAGGQLLLEHAYSGYTSDWIIGQGANHGGGNIEFSYGSDVWFEVFRAGQIATGSEIAPDVDPGGLCLNQGANDGNILTFKSSDVAHGGSAETDTFAEFKKAGGATGGLSITGFADSGGTPLTIEANVASSSNTVFAVDPNLNLFSVMIKDNTTANAANIYIDPTTSELFRSTSSKRYKKNITDMNIDTSKIYDLRPVEFDDKNSGDHLFGLIAEEVAEVLPELVTFNKKGQPEAVNYAGISVLLLNELKKLRNNNPALFN